MKNRMAAVIFLFIAVVSVSAGETFVFKYRKGEMFKILSTVYEDVYINGAKSHYSFG